MNIIAIEHLVKDAIIKKYKLAIVVVSTPIDSENFLDNLREYNQFFFDTHEAINSECMDAILSNNMAESSLGCHVLDKYFNLFRKPRTPAEELASELCMKHIKEL